MSNVLRCCQQTKEQDHWIKDSNRPSLAYRSKPTHIYISLPRLLYLKVNHRQSDKVFPVDFTGWWEGQQHGPLLLGPE